MEENLNWLENTYDKIGNQIELKPIGFTSISSDDACKALLYINVTNKGLSDLLVPMYNVTIDPSIKILSQEPGSAFGDNYFSIQYLQKRSN